MLAPKFAGGGEADRQIAVTIDDLPADAAFSMTATTITEINTNLLKGLRDEKIPAVGFVNEKKVYHWGEVDQRIKALAMWVDSGFELGNHGFSHLSLNNAGLKAWEDDVIHGENVIGLLLGEHNMKPRYFRHPYLATGRDLQTRREAEAFLTGRNYRIAPVTVDPWDWMFGPVYADAKKRGDAALQQEVLNSYLLHADAVLAYDEQLSRETLGYEPKQILLLHDNQLNADHLKELAAVIKLPFSAVTFDSRSRNPQTWIQVHRTGRCLIRSSLQYARYLCRGRRKWLAGPLGNNPRQAPQGLSGFSRGNHGALQQVAKPFGLLICARDNCVCTAEIKKQKCHLCISLKACRPGGPPLRAFCEGGDVPRRRFVDVSSNLMRVCFYCGQKKVTS